MRHYLTDRILLHLMRICVVVIIFLLAQGALPTWWEMIQQRLVHVDAPVEFIQTHREQARLEAQFRWLSIALLALLWGCLAYFRNQAYGKRTPQH